MWAKTNFRYPKGKCAAFNCMVRAKRFICFWPYSMARGSGNGNTRSKTIGKLMANLGALTFRGPRNPSKLGKAPSDASQARSESRVVVLDSCVPMASNVRPFPSAGNIRRLQMRNVEMAMGAGLLAELGQKTGLSSVDVISRLALALPDVFNCYPHNERQLTNSELRAIDRLKLIFTRIPCDNPLGIIEHPFQQALSAVYVEEATLTNRLPRLRA